MDGKRPTWGNLCATCKAWYVVIPKGFKDERKEIWSITGQQPVLFRLQPPQSGSDGVGPNVSLRTWVDQIFR